MARKATAQAAPSGDPQAQHAPLTPLTETPPVVPFGGEGTATDAGANAPALPEPPISPEPPSPATGLDTRERVKALVLHDSIYGKCGDVREFEAEHVPALKGAGYIDPHPKAVESAGG